MRFLTFTLFAIFLFAATHGKAQMYILNEDFNTANGTTPPENWNNITQTGTPTDLWHFDNPGSQTINFPITEPFAIFDAAAISDNVQAETVILETRSFDASVSNFILLQFDHYFNPGNNATAKLSAFDGENWVEISSWNTATPNSKPEIIDISTAVGGITNARLRFSWEGNGTGLWALDNIRILAPLPIDAGLTKLNSPQMPFASGEHAVSVTLSNFGYQNLTNTTINWRVNGEIMPAYNWTGNLSFTETQENIQLGTYDFQEPVLLEIWQSNPNGLSDLNPDNDSIVRMMRPSLCGDYTIGGNNPDFETFGEAVDVLNFAGVSCPVTFKIRDGVYNEHIIIRDIPGSSELNTVTFESESADSSLVTLTHENRPVIRLVKTDYISFNKIGFVGYRIMEIDQYSSFVNITNCYFEIGWEGAVIINSGSNNINIQNNSINSGGQGILVYATTYEINIENNVFNDQVYQSIYINNPENINGYFIVKDNIINSYNSGIEIFNSTRLKIFNNRINFERADAHILGHGINIENCDSLQVFNNFITSNSIYQSSGISVNNTQNSLFNFNSIAINNGKNYDNKGISINDLRTSEIKNNIFYLKNDGYPVFISNQNQPLALDFNNYFSGKGFIGSFNDSTFKDLNDWVSHTGQDHNSLSTPPFYTSISDLTPNQIVLNDAGTPIPNISTDITGNTRDPLNPDIGAKEFTPCNVDAGINLISQPTNPVPSGENDIKVILQNQGLNNLTSTNIYWQVNGEAQPTYSWNGNLDYKESIEVNIGSYDFYGGLFEIKTWTDQPNGNDDCNPLNDTIIANKAAKLCGEYTIGGNNPDFETFGEAVDVLNFAGISCPVTFKVRDGVYEEQLVIRQITGASEINTVTFESESADSSLVTLTHGIRLIDANYMTFNKIGFIGSFEIFNSKLISISNCKINGTVTLESNTKQIVIRNTFFENINLAINISFAGDSSIFVNNIFSNCRQAVRVWYGTNIIFRNNNINNSIIGLGVTHSNNNLIENNNIHINSNIETVVGILTENSTQIKILNNYIRAEGSKQARGLQLIGGSNNMIIYNSINIQNTDLGLESIALMIRGSNSLTQVKNNIFALKNPGYPVYIEPNTSSNFQADYNNYYAPNDIIGYANGVTFYNLDDWGQTINGDANSKNLPPLFAAEDNPLPYQRELNGAGIPIPGILLDINGLIRNDAAPDIGCTEFFVDFGVTDLINPNLDCAQTELEDVTVMLRQFGDIPFIDLKLAYQVNGGPVFYDTIPGAIYNDIEFTFDATVDLSQDGEYRFKVWLINTRDDNLNNDTLVVTRYSKPAPEVISSWDNLCTWTEVRFEGSATIAEPYTIASYIWEFGDSTYTENPVAAHIYESPGSYEATFKAFSNAGCFTEQKHQLYIDPSYQLLQLSVNVENEVCFGDGTASATLNASGGTPPYQYLLNNETAPAQLNNLTSGEYLFTVVDQQQCIVSKDTTIYPLVYLNPQITALPDSGFSPLEVQFSFTANNPDSWVWEFGDGTSDTTLQPIHSYTSYGYQYPVLTLNSGEPHFCVETDTVSIFVDVKVEMEANNVFTPNGDGYNDFFEVRTEGIGELEVSLFDRQNKLIYEINEVGGKWDGNNSSGNEAPEAEYYYYLKATAFNGDSHEKQGVVMLLRDDSKVFPNPVKSGLFLKAEGFTDQSIDVNIFSIEGTKMLSKIVPNDDIIRFDIDYLPGGLYIIQLKDSKMIKSIRFIKY